MMIGGVEKHICLNHLTRHLEYCYILTYFFIHFYQFKNIGVLNNAAIDVPKYFKLGNESVRSHLLKNIGPLAKIY